MAMLRDEASARLVELDSTQAANALGPHADAVIKNDWVQPNKRIFNDAKISDHFAIIPTMQAPKNLSEAELKVYDMVVRRFLAIFHPAAKFLNTTRITTVKANQFRTEGKVLVEPGWLAIYGRSASTGSDDTLVAVGDGENAQTEAIESRELATRPPARYSEATLLSAMEGAGKTVESDELREAMAGKGLGTPATRASIIEGLIRETYLIREGKELIPTTKAFQLLTLLRGLGVNELTMPELTGEWEHKLARIEQGELARNNFMDEINAMTEQIVARAKNYGSTSIPGNYATLKTPCPTCGSVVKENYKRYACTNEDCEFSITKIPGSRQLEVEEAEELLTNRTIGPLQGFRSRMGRPFAAIIKINDEDKLEFDFGQNDDENAEPVDFSGHESLGQCPKCQNAVYEHGMSYICEKATGPEKTCDFKSGKVILQQEIEAEQMRKLLSEGKTDLLTGFVSSRTHRKFKAFLSRGEDGKVGFEFEPRPEKGTKKGAKGAKGAKKSAKAEADGSDQETADKASKKPAAKKPAKKAASKSAKKAGAKKASKKASKKSAD
jgi:DNA topoisomerase-3